jgi:hypothetical protein
MEIKMSYFRGGNFAAGTLPRQVDLQSQKRLLTKDTFHKNAELKKQRKTYTQYKIQNGNGVIKKVMVPVGQ